MGNLEAALDCLHLAQVELQEPAKISFAAFKSLLMPLTFVQIFLVQKQYAKARTLTARLLEDLEHNRIGHYHIRLLIWQSIAYWGLKQEAQALASLKDALTLAAPGGYLHIFTIEGSRMMPLLRRARTCRDHA